MNDTRDWLSLRELDEAAGTTKGTAFRCFKRHADTLNEGTDYCVLRPEDHTDAIAAMRSAGRLYASSVNIVLLSRATGTRLLQELKTRLEAER